MMFNSFSQTVKETAYGQWPYILQSLAGLDDNQTDTRLKSKGTPCPNCGGNDRYSFKNSDDGSWGCRHCGGGDGWELLKRLNHWSFSEAINAVAELLQISMEKRYFPQQIEHKARKRLIATQRREEIRAAEILRKHSKMAEYALDEWHRAAPADCNHPYLISHHLPPFNLKQIVHPAHGNCLLVPLINEAGELRNLERINQEGMKRPIKGAQKKELFYQFGNSSFVVYVAESWSTAAAIHLGKPCRPVVMAAMSATNLNAVTEIALRLHPESRIVIAADHDPAGIKAAVSVASHYDLPIVMPEPDGYDFCDLHIQAAEEACHEY